MEQGGKENKSKVAEFAARWLQATRQNQSHNNTDRERERSVSQGSEDDELDENRDVVAKFAFRWLVLTKQRQMEYSTVNTEDYYSS